MSKYPEAIGIWELRIGGAEFDLRPIKGDNLRLSKIMLAAKKNKDEGLLFEKMYEFIKGLIARDYPPENDEEKDRLDMYVEYNIQELLTETLIAFRWAKREDIDSLKQSTKDAVGDVIKNLN